MQLAQPSNLFRTTFTICLVVTSPPGPPGAGLQTGGKEVSIMPLPDKGLKTGEAAPPWQLAGLDDKLVSLDQFQGQPLLLIFLRGTWCPNCRKQMEAVRN